MRSNKIIVTLGSIAALATAMPAFGWSQGWDWDEDCAPTVPVQVAPSKLAPSSSTVQPLQPAELDALSEPFCIESTTSSGSCQIHA